VKLDGRVSGLDLKATASSAAATLPVSGTV